MTETLERKLTTILCADVCGYSRLMNTDEPKTLERLKSTREVFARHIQDYSGRIINMTGDGLVADFGSVVKAVQCAVEIQNEINADNNAIPDDDKMLYRIGLNLGDVIVDGDDIFGEGVNVAARLETMAPTGGICISGSVFEQVKNKMPKSFHFLGNKSVKNIAEPIPVYSLSLAEQPENAIETRTTPDAGTRPHLSDEEEDAKLRAIVKRQSSFYRQAMIFGCIIVFLFFINLASSTNYWWFLWPAAGMILTLAIRAIRIFGRGAADWEERKVNELKARNRKA